VLVVRHDGETRHDRLERLPPIAALPGLVPDVAQFFVQIDRR
jgi:hypothetical protein